jgi:hypothetical protein
MPPVFPFGPSLDVFGPSLGFFDENYGYVTEPSDSTTPIPEGIFPVFTGLGTVSIPIDPTVFGFPPLDGSSLGYFSESYYDVTEPFDSTTRIPEGIFPVFSGLGSGSIPSDPTVFGFPPLDQSDPYSCIDPPC